MLRIALVSLFVLQVKSDEKSLSPKCNEPFSIVENPINCCTFPSLFKDENYKDCDIERKLNTEGIPEQGPFDIHCDKQTCLLKKNGLMKDETSVDREAVTAYLEKWAGDNEDLKNSIKFAKNKCVKEILPGPAELCEANKLVYCIVSTIFEKCPTWEESDLCQKVKEHIQGCSS